MYTIHPSQISNSDRSECQNFISNSAKVHQTRSLMCRDTEMPDESTSSETSEPTEAIAEVSESQLFFFDLPLLTDVFKNLVSCKNCRALDSLIIYR